MENGRTEKGVDMTDKKPKDEIGLLRENLKFFLFDRVENTIEEQKEIEDVSIGIFDKAVKIAREQGKLAGSFLSTDKNLGKNELTRRKENYLAFIQEQMHDRKSSVEEKIGKDERCTTEYLMLNMCWQEFVKEFYGQYPALDMEKNRALWIKIDERLKSQIKEAKK